MSSDVELAVQVGIVRAQGRAGMIYEVELAATTPTVLRGSFAVMHVVKDKCGWKPSH